MRVWYCNMLNNTKNKTMNSDGAVEGTAYIVQNVIQNE